MFVGCCIILVSSASYGNGTATPLQGSKEQKKGDKSHKISFKAVVYSGMVFTLVAAGLIAFGSGQSNARDDEHQLLKPDQSNTNLDNNQKKQPQDETAGRTGNGGEQKDEVSRAMNTNLDTNNQQKQPQNKTAGRTGNGDEQKDEYEIFMEDQGKAEQAGPETWRWQKIEDEGLRRALAKHLPRAAGIFRYKKGDLCFICYQCDALQVQKKRYNPELYGEKLTYNTKKIRYYALYMSRTLKRIKGRWNYFKGSKYLPFSNDGAIKKLNGLLSEKGKEYVSYSLQKDVAYNGTKGEYLGVNCNWMLQFYDPRLDYNSLSNYARFAIRRVPC